MNEDVNNYLFSLNIQKQKKKHDKSHDWKEQLLTEQRLGFKLNQSDKLFSNHRSTAGVGYKQFKRCQHPQHQPGIGKVPATRYVPMSTCISTAEKFFSTGPVLCFNHMKNENKTDKDERSDNHVTQADPDYEAPKPVVSENIFNDSEAGVTDLTDMSWI